MSETTKIQDEKMKTLIALGNQDQSDVNSPIEPTGGWIDIDTSKFSYEGRLYKKSLRFQVKPVTVGTIKYFSTLDENNPLSVNDALTFVIEQHIRVLDGKRVLKSLDVIYEHDRFFFVMLVHSYSGAPTALSYDANCSHQKCNHPQDVSISPYNIKWSEISEKGDSYINPDEGMINIPTKNFGILKYRPLTLSESGELTEFMLESRRKGEDIEKLFLQVAPFIAHEKKAGENAASVYQKYLKITSDPKYVALLMHIIELLNIAQLLEIEVDCKKCSRPFRSQISSVKGLRNIFLANDIADELS